MKKIIMVIMMFSFGIMNAFADDCQNLANTNWAGSVTYSDNTTAKLNVTIKTVTPDPTSQGSYVITGVANNVPFAGSAGSMDNQCSVNMLNNTTVQSLTIDNSDSSVNILSQNVNASQIAALHGHVNGKFIQPASSSMNKQ